MLESLGYREVAERDEADLILFNTCSIREKADERFVAHLHEAKRLKRRDPERVIGVGGCWAQSVKEEVFRQFPFVDVAFGPGQVHKLAEFLTATRSPRRASSSSRASPATCRRSARATFQAWVQISVGCNMRLLVLHRPVDARARGVAAARGARRRGRAAGRRRRARGHAARPERQLLRARPAAAARRVRRAAARASTRSTGIDRIRYTSPHPKDMREDVIRAHAELAARVRAHPPAAAVGLDAGSSRRMRRTYTASATSTASR